MDVLQRSAKLPLGHTWFVCFSVDMSGDSQDVSYIFFVLEDMPSNNYVFHHDGNVLSWAVLNDSRQSAVELFFDILVGVICWGIKNGWTTTLIFRSLF